jgi:hypothetical protein
MPKQFENIQTVTYVSDVWFTNTVDSNVFEKTVNLQFVNFFCTVGVASMRIWSEETAFRGSDEIASLLLKVTEQSSQWKQKLSMCFDFSPRHNKIVIILSLLYCLEQAGFYS